MEYTSRLAPGPIDPDDDKKCPRVPIVIRRYVDDPTPLPREDVLAFFYPHSLQIDPLEEEELARRQMRRDVFLLAFAAVQSLPATDRWSFYQIAGIHGLPHVAYDGAKCFADPEISWWGGYCQHGSPLFPTWHRPYMMLLEQSIIRQAKLIARSLSDPQEKDDVEGMADQLRFPYWDWANYTSQMLGIPDVFTVNIINLAYPWNSFAHRRSIPNPLKSFVLPVDVATTFASSDNLNPAAKPNYEVPGEGTPFIPLGFPTVRHVSAAYTTQNDKLNLTLMRNAQTTLVEGVQGVFHHQDWLSFSNHYWSPDLKLPPEYGHYSSIELVHDILHDTVGGPGGQMSYPETAAFDPIFFFHHCNVDRLVALWQYSYPEAWIPSDPSNSEPDIDGTYTIEPNSAVDSSTELTPFRCTFNSFVSSDDVRLVERDCGYSYPELVLAREEEWTPFKMLYYMLRLYEPPQHFIHLWFLVLEGINKGAFNGPYSIRVFLDLPNADSDTPISSPHYAGAISVFARQSSGPGPVARCSNCEQRPYLRASLDITKTMLRLGITTAPEMTDNDVGTVTPPTSNPLEGAIKLVYVNRKGDALCDPVPLPQLTVVYQERVPDEQIYEYLLKTDNPDTRKLPISPNIIHFPMDQSPIIINFPLGPK